MFCAKCGKEVAADAAFCAGCGAAVEMKSKKLTIARWFGGCSCLILLAVVVLIIIGSCVGPKKKNEDKEKSSPVTTVQVEKRGDDFTIDPARIKLLQVTNEYDKILKKYTVEIEIGEEQEHHVGIILYTRYFKTDYLYDSKTDKDLIGAAGKWNSRVFAYAGAEKYQNFVKAKITVTNLAKKEAVLEAECRLVCWKFDEESYLILPPVKIPIVGDNFDMLFKGRN